MNTHKTYAVVGGILVLLIAVIAVTIFSVRGAQVAVPPVSQKADFASVISMYPEMSYFGNEVFADINGDSRVDAVFLTMAPNTVASSSVNYYVVASLNTPQGYSASQPLLIGADIAPQTTEARISSTTPTTIVVNYAIRPSQGKSLFLKYDSKTNQFGELVQDFEGEADPARMTLDMKAWNWVDARNTADKFVLTFDKDGRFSARTDCNGVGGNYVSSKAVDAIEFSQMISTMMFCEGSYEQEFTGMLLTATKYQFNGRGQLILTLKDGKVMVFN